MKLNYSILFVGAILLSLLACTKYAPPGKVKRVVTKGEWTITRMMHDNGDSTSNFENYTFKFTEQGKVLVEGDTAIVGTWLANGDQKPTIWELQIKPFVPFNMLNADWQFDICSKNKLELSLQKSSAKDILVFSKKE